MIAEFGEVAPLLAIASIALMMLGCHTELLGSRAFRLMTAGVAIVTACAYVSVTVTALGVSTFAPLSAILWFITGLILLHSLSPPAAGDR